MGIPVLLILPEMLTVLGIMPPMDSSETEP
jgi:hypothetical protein